MKVKCLECGHVGEAVFPPPKGTKYGEEAQSVPACAKCKSGNITRLESVI